MGNWLYLHGSTIRLSFIILFLLRRYLFPYISFLPQLHLHGLIQVLIHRSCGWLYQTEFSYLEYFKCASRISFAWVDMWQTWPHRPTDSRSLKPDFVLLEEVNLRKFALSSQCAANRQMRPCSHWLLGEQIERGPFCWVVIFNQDILISWVTLAWQRLFIFAMPPER